MARRDVLRVEYQPNNDEIWIRPGRGDEGAVNPEDAANKVSVEPLEPVLGGEKNIKTENTENTAQILTFT